MKVGICAFLRRGVQVHYYTNKEIWEWLFSRRYWKGDTRVLNKLCIRLHPSKPRKAKQDLTINEDTREARASAAKTTTVIVQAPYDMKIDFGDYLFLHPPKGAVLSTDLGTILLDNQYRHKIFVKGIYIEERGRNNPPPLRYGIDFSQASLDRDRRSFMTHSEAANNMAWIWDTIIARAPEEDTTKKYLELLLEEENYLETLSAEKLVSQGSAKALMKALSSTYPGKFFYSKEDKEISEVLQIPSNLANFRLSES
jgi:hypothetical protein